MTNKTQTFAILISPLAWVLSISAICCEEMKFEGLIGQLGKSERYRGSLGTFQVMESPVTREVIAKGSEIIPDLLGLIDDGEDPRQLASAVFCLRHMRFWSAVDRIERLETKVEEMRKDAEPVQSEVESGSGEFAVNESALGVALLSYQVQTFLRAADQAQQNAAGQPATRALSE